MTKAVQRILVQAVLPREKAQHVDALGMRLCGQAHRLVLLALFGLLLPQVRDHRRKTEAAFISVQHLALARRFLLVQPG